MLLTFQKIQEKLSHRSIISGMAFPGLFILVLLFLWPTSYETNDDFFMNVIASGFYSGRPDEHLIYSHFLLGLALKFLYQVYAGINWYFYYLLFFHWLGWSLICYTMLKNTRNLFVLPVLLIILVLFETYFYLNLQFTTTAAILACGGISLILTGESWSRPFKMKNLAGVLIIILASMIRYEPALLASLLTAPVILLGTHWKKWLGALVLLALLPTGIFLSESLNKRYYSANPEWDIFFRELKNGNRFNDNPAFYQKVINERKNLKAINGWSENDMLLFGVFFRNYAPVYNVDAYNKLYKAYTKFRTKSFRDNFYLFRRDFGKLPILVLAGLAFLYSSTRRKWSILAQTALLALVSYYIYSNIHMKERVIYSALLCLSVCYLYFISSGKQEKSFLKLKPEYIFRSGLILLLFVSGIMLYSQSAKTIKRQKSQRVQLKKDLALLNDPQSCYIIYGGCIPFEGVPPVKNRFTYQNREFFMLSLSAFHKSPLNKPNLKRFGQSSLEHALGDPHFKVVTFADSAMIPLTPERLDRFSRDHLGCSLKIGGDQIIANSDKRIFWFNSCLPIPSDEKEHHIQPGTSEQ